FYASDREFDPVYGSFDNTWTYPNPTKLVAVPLRRDVKSPLAARNDDENSALDTNKKDDAKPADKKPDEKKPDEKKPDEKKPGDKTTDDKAQDKKTDEKPADEKKTDDRALA